MMNKGGGQLAALANILYIKQFNCVVENKLIKSKIRINVCFYSLSTVNQVFGCCCNFVISQTTSSFGLFNNFVNRCINFVD